MNIQINTELSQKCPDITLSCILADVRFEKMNADLWYEIETEMEAIRHKPLYATPSKIPAIAESRLAYKALGKDPARYRLSAEALIRRILQGKAIYQINNVVDLLNLTSIKTGFSIGGYNANAIEGDVLLRIGKKKEPYEAIGRGELNILYLPTFTDEKGPFGTPTSDSVRTMVKQKVKTFLMIIISFHGTNKLKEATDLAIELLKKYAKATNLKTWLVTK